MCCQAVLMALEPGCTIACVLIRTIFAVVEVRDYWLGRSIGASEVSMSTPKLCRNHFCANLVKGVDNFAQSYSLKSLVKLNHGEDRQ